MYAWPHNETSTGVMAPVTRVAGDDGALTVDRRHERGGRHRLRRRRRPTSTTSRRRRTSRSDGGLWFALVLPRRDRAGRADRRERPLHPRVPQSLKNAVDNSRLNQTLNTPALATLLLLENQLEWINGNGGLAWADARTRESSSALYDWAERIGVRDPVRRRPADRSQVVVTIDFDDVDRRRGASRKILRANGIVDTEPYRKLGRNQLRVATFAAIEPDDVRALTASIDYVLEQIGLRPVRFWLSESERRPDPAPARADARKASPPAPSAWLVLSWRRWCSGLSSSRPGSAGSLSRPAHRRRARARRDRVVVQVIRRRAGQPSRDGSSD